MRFTSEEAYEAHEEGDPLLITRKTALAIVTEHGATAEGIAEFRAQVAIIDEQHDRFDAWDVLAWLGY